MIQAIRFLGRHWLLLLMLVSVTGCAGSLESARPRTLGASATPPSARCTDLDDRRMTWSAVAKGSAVLAGASGISMLPVGEEHEEARIGIAAGGIAFAALVAGAVVIADGADTSWVRECMP